MDYRLGKRKEKRGVLASSLAAALLCSAVAGAARATYLDTGVIQLRSLNPALNGTGVSVAQVEATDYTGSATAPYDPSMDLDNFEVNPSSVSGSGAPIITYRGKSGTASTTTFNSSQGNAHASAVAVYFYASNTGVSPGVTAVVNMNANYLLYNLLETNTPFTAPLGPSGAPAVSIVNQSFDFPNASASATNFINQLYDNYVSTYGTIFISGVGDGGAPQPPATAFNVIAVGAYGGSSSVGPTSGVSMASDGRSKPDITAPESATSFSTPQVSGIAALLVQAGQTGLGGSSSSTEIAAVDGRTIKALLLNGATKPSDWTHTTTQPLDTRYGAGIVNAYASYLNLTAGVKAASKVNTSQTPFVGTGVGAEGWNFTTLSSTTTTQGVAHYSIDLSAANGPSTLTSTLIWYRPAGTATYSNGSLQSLSITAINNLDLMLYNSSGALVDESDSSVDNVQQLYTGGLAPGHYDLEVVKLANGVTPTETYAMAFNTTGGAVNLVVNGIVDLHGESQSVGGITGNGTLTSSVAGVTALLTVVGSSEFDGTIQNSAGAIAIDKTTGGIFTLTGANTYTGGTTVDGGTFLVSNTTGSATGTGNVTLNGGTFGGHGLITGQLLAGTGAHTIAPSATLSGTSTGKLTVGSLVTNVNTTFAFNLVTPEITRGTSSVNDMINITTSGGLTLNGGTIQIANTSTGTASLGYYKIIQYTGAIGGSLTSLTLPQPLNGVAYVLDLNHDPGFIDLHRGLIGDTDDNGIVNFSDFITLSENFGLSNVGWSGGDFNGDGVVNFADFIALSENFGQTIGSNEVAQISPNDEAMLQAFGSEISSVPEPATLALLACGTLSLLASRRRPRNSRFTVFS